MTVDLATLLLLGGLCHFGILTASALVPRVLSWRNELRKLQPLSRHLVWTHGVFIVLVILAFGLISVVASHDLAGGSRLARLVCGFIATFWLARLAIQLFLFDPTPYLTSRWLRLGYHGLTAVFTYLGVVYAYAAVLPRETGGIP